MYHLNNKAYAQRRNLLTKPNPLPKTHLIISRSITVKKWEGVKLHKNGDNRGKTRPDKLAQLVVQSPCKRKVIGSSPVFGSTSLKTDIAFLMS